VEAKDGQVKALTQQAEKLQASLDTEQRARQEAEAGGARLTQRVQTLEAEEQRLLRNGPSCVVVLLVLHLSLIWVGGVVYLLFPGVCLAPFFGVHMGEGALGMPS
jgi:multidrug efflux pump subunit AcrA (membrane-fusion protein)